MKKQWMAGLAAALMMWCTGGGAVLAQAVSSEDGGDAPPEPLHKHTPPLVEPYLMTGQLATGETALTEHLTANPDDAQARFGLGTLQFLQAVEGLMQSWHRHGLDSRLASDFGIPFLRLPAPPNRRPQPIGYSEWRAILQQFNTDLAAAEATLAQVQDADVKLPLRFGSIRLDMNNDGLAGEDEQFWKIYIQYNRRAQQLSENLTEAEQAFPITFDAGDVHWLRGYCHLLMAMTDALLAHDSQDLFERTAHLFFPQVKTPHTFLLRRQRQQYYDNNTFVDFIALIHLSRLDVVEPQRLQSALSHLQTTINQSRLSWDSIEAESDNDREWVPNPSQSSVVPVEVTPEMIAGWRSFLDEADAILAGEKLVPHWRAQGGNRGINVNRIFTAPQTFDLVLWVQGTAATPYLDYGQLTEPEVWQQLWSVFSGNFIGFAIWFN